MEQTIRTFIAIELNQDIRKTLKVIQDELRKAGADVKWVEPDNIHLTLKFLGEVENKKIESLIGAIEMGLLRYPVFSFYLTHLGAFPKLENPRVIWVGINSEKEELKRLAGSLEENLKSLGFKKEEKGFAPHITIGRLRSPLNKFALSKMLKTYSLPELINQNVKEVVLFKSTLTSSGPIYEVLKKFPLSQLPPAKPVA